MVECKICKDRGFVDRGDQDFPCYCPKGNTTLFRQEGVAGHVTGEEIWKHFLPRSPEPIKVNKYDPIPASSLPGRSKGTE